jgi:hypothetical protein
MENSDEDHDPRTAHSLPTFGRIGILAPVPLIVLRFVRGFCLGGEWGGAVLMVVEHAPSPSARGLHCGLGDVPVSLHRFDSVLAAVGLGRPCAGRSVSGRGLGHSRLQQAAQVFLGAWNARACL